jgi:hypothetical protein
LLLLLLQPRLLLQIWLVYLHVILLLLLHVLLLLLLVRCQTTRLPQLA